MLKAASPRRLKRATSFATLRSLRNPAWRATRANETPWASARSALARRHPIGALAGGFDDPAQGRLLRDRQRAQRVVLVGGHLLPPSTRSIADAVPRQHSFPARPTSANRTHRHAGRGAAPVPGVR